MGKELAAGVDNELNILLNIVVKKNNRQDWLYTKQKRAIKVVTLVPVFLFSEVETWVKAAERTISYAIS
ncbi:hypothetical protein GRF59_18495 [Paenibacillus sp. HJL G12]|uniref:Uncharacterized protein n=1 Tax=Paenibacillus dendrobii TaxID=2691084 RepID=A0A7X3LH98_9BACL|nr:hypothetical protein [Paenibacillus dendrobii]MWV45606.1 hypothetical protein [Paenibacillus dendrobii]